MLPIYFWLGGRLNGESKATVNADSLERSVVGHDPLAIYKFMAAPASDQRFIKYSMGTGYFWAAMKSYLEGNLSSARTDLERYLAEPHGGISAFETAAAARLRQLLK